MSDPTPMSDPIPTVIRSLDVARARVLRVLAANYLRGPVPRRDLVRGLPLLVADVPALIAGLHIALGENIRITQQKKGYLLKAANPAVLRWSAGPITVDLPRSTILIPGWSVRVEDCDAFAVAATLIRRCGETTSTAELTAEAVGAADDLKPAVAALRRAVGPRLVSNGPHGWAMPRALLARLRPLEARLLRALVVAGDEGQRADTLTTQVGCPDAEAVLALGLDLSRALSDLAIIRVTDGALALRAEHPDLLVWRAPGWNLDARSGVLHRRDATQRTLREPVLGLIAALTRQGGAWSPTDLVAAETGIDVTELDRVIREARRQFCPYDVVVHPDHGLRMTVEYR